jgi:hypothetical protein
MPGFYVLIQNRLVPSKGLMPAQLSGWHDEAVCIHAGLDDVVNAETAACSYVANSDRDNPRRKVPFFAPLGLVKGGIPRCQACEAAIELGVWPGGPNWESITE